jgi:predicted GIY-YIG superfamily endonuclease
MAQKRPYQRYRVHVKGKVAHGGITTNFEQRKQQHKQQWPRSIVRKVGGKVTEKTAREWEREQGYN